MTINYRKVLSKDTPDHLIEEITALNNRLVPVICKEIEDVNKDIALNSLVRILSSLIFASVPGDAEQKKQAAQCYCDMLMNEIKLHCEEIEK